MGWVVRFSVKNPITDGELIVSQLWDRGTTGVYEADAGEVIAGFETKAEADDIALWLADSAGRIDGPVAVEPAATGDEWAVNTEAVVHRVTSQGHDFTVTITAGATFGHGGHPTTELALELLLASIEPGQRVLDLGTGSGILAIAAAKAGAEPVTALDIDPNAVAVAQENANANGVVIDCSTATVEEVIAAGAKAEGPPAAGFDLIVMNVLLPVHRELAPAVFRALAPGGRLVTSGYLVDQRPELIECYSVEPEMSALGAATADGWAADTFGRGS